MKTIGILTYHRYYNYGTALQAYALQNYIARNFDCKAELIDYLTKNEFVGKKLLLTRLKRLGVYIKDFSKYYTLHKSRGGADQKVAAFDCFFQNDMVMSSEFTDSIDGLKSLCEQYDAVMIGSDQTWNPYVAGKKEFLLDYLESGSVTKLAYAPSLGMGKVPDAFTETYKHALSDFKALSCRERGGTRVLTELLGRDVEFVLDPTLLLTPSDWEKFAQPVEVRKPYLLTYFLGDNKAHRKVAERIAAEKNLQIVALPASYLEMKNKSIDLQYVGPGGFISLVKNASFVCTDSFHGTMFSINFGREFMSFPKRNDADFNSDNNRLYDALDVFGLQDRLGVGGKLSLELIDYEVVNEKLSALRKSSAEYLEKAIAMV